MAASLFCPHCGALNPAGESACFACGHALAAAAPDAPRLLRQRYRLLRQIGVGGFGAVYKAEDRELGNRLVAVKEMSAHALTPEEVQEATEGFHREALLLARLSHPNLPRIYEQFEEAGRWYLVMDFIEGQTLEDYLAQRGGKLPVNEALALGLQLTSVLGYLHSRQPPIVFRDLKPSNVIRTPEGQVYLIDFGIARLFKPGQQKDTIAFGSPGYAAPEQYGKAQTTPRSDVFSLGALLHHLLTGIDPSETPFRFKPLTMPHPAGLSTLIERMVDLDVEKRPATMELVRRDLERLLSDHSSWLDKDAAQVLPGAYITPASTQTTAAYPHLTPSATSWQQPPSAWQGQHALQTTQAGPTLQPTPTRKKRKVGRWVLVVIVAWFGFFYLTNLNHSSYSSDASTPDGYTTPVGTAAPANTGIQVYAVAWSPDGKEIASGGGDNELQIWDAATGKQTITLNTDFAVINAVAWSPNGSAIAAAGDKHELQIWHADGSSPVTYQIASGLMTNALAWSPDNRHVVLAANDGTLWEVDTTTGTSSLIYQATASLAAVAWSPNGKYFAAGGGEQTVQVWNSATKKVVYTYQDGSWVDAIAWSPDSKRIVSADNNGQVAAWDALSGANAFTFSGTQYTLNTVAWSPDGRYVASGDDADTVYVWAVGNAKPTYTYSKQMNYIQAVAWSPNSERIASASDDGTVQVWDALTGANVVSYQQA